MSRDDDNLLMLSGDTQLATGREGVFFGVLEEMSRHFARIDVISPPPAGAITTTELFGNVHLHPSRTSKWRQVQHIIGVAARLLGERSYRIMTSHDYGFFYNGVAAYQLHRKFGVPYVSEIHHVPGYPKAANLRERFDLPMNRVYARFAARHAAAIRVVNETEMPPLLQSFGVPADKIKVIPSLYLDLERFRPIDVDKRFDVMLCGRLVVNKRFDLVIDALGKLRERGRKATVHLVGEGPLKQALMEKAVVEGVCDWIEHTPFLATADDLARAYNEARVLVCASTSEGGPRVTCEAMACGTPVISTPVGVMGQLIDDGESGYLFDWDVSVLAERIATLLDDASLARHLGERGREAVAPFERTKMIRNYAEQLKALGREAAPCG